MMQCIDKTKDPKVKGVLCLIPPAHGKSVIITALANTLHHHMVDVKKEEAYILIVCYNDYLTAVNYDRYCSKLT